MTVLCAARIRLKASNNKGPTDALRYCATRQIICTVHVRITRRYFVIYHNLSVYRVVQLDTVDEFSAVHRCLIYAICVCVLTNDRCLHSSRNHWQRSTPKRADVEITEIERRMHRMHDYWQLSQIASLLDC